MPQKIYIVDAFSHGPFTGNPAAVCPLGNPRTAPWMQGVAMEMNQAETAFYWPTGANAFALRWFTPACEVDLCGHATLASAHVLFNEGEASPVRFMTHSGELVCTKTEGGIEMDFPNEAPTPTDDPGSKAALGVQPVWIGANRMDWFFELESEEQVRALAPDMARVAALGKRGVIVTARPDDRTPERQDLALDFVSRFFAPQSGIAEDPVTGSAHCALGPYWAQKLGKGSVTGYQASKRGGTVRVEVRGDRVGLAGRAVTVVEGTLRA
jgi:PhzF family phenazine biosynthesis protein